MVLQSRLRIPDYCSTSLTMAEQRILEDPLAFSIQLLADFHNTLWNADKVVIPQYPIRQTSGLALD